MDPVKTGCFISGLRKEKGFTQKELAERLNVSDKAISRWETGKGFPDTALLKPLSDVLGVSVSELLEGERFPAVEHQERTDRAIVKSMADSGRKLMVTVGVCVALAVLVLVLCCTIFLPAMFVTTTVEFINNSQITTYYPLGEVADLVYNDFGRQELKNGYAYYSKDGTRRYGFLNTAEGPVMRYLHCSGEGELFDFSIGEKTVIEANQALGLEEQSLRKYLEEQGFRNRYDLMSQETFLGRSSLVYIDGERCNWYPYTKDNVFINICISAYEGNRLLAFDIGLFDEMTEDCCKELLSGFALTLEDPEQLVTCQLRDSYQQWEKIVITAKDPGKGNTLYLYINDQCVGKFNGSDPYHPEECTYTFEMWGAPVTVLVTTELPDNP